MKVPSHLPFTASAATLALAGFASAQVVTVPPTVPDFNPGGLTLIEAAGNTKTSADFATDVAAAWGADLGGVIDFGDAFDLGNSAIESSYAGVAALPVTLTADVPFIGVSGFGSVNETSTPNAMHFDVFGGAPAPEIITVSLDGPAASEVGFAALSRDPNGGTLVVTGLFSDGSSDVRTITMPAVLGSGNTFVHFAAPAGETVTGFIWDQTGITPEPDFDKFVGLDDFGFVVIPEPATAGLLAMTGLALLRRRG
jgi:hypothetical protein